jgi:hypothetical protein
MNFISLYKFLKHLAFLQVFTAFNNLAIWGKSLRVIGYISAIATSPIFPPLLHKGPAVTRSASKTMWIRISPASTSKL